MPANKDPAAARFKTLLRDLFQFEKDRNFIVDGKLTVGAETVYINDNSIIPSAVSFIGLCRKNVWGM